MPKTKKTRKRRDSATGKYKARPAKKRVKVSLKKRKSLKKEYLVGGKVITSAKMNDKKGDGILHLKKKETSQSTKFTWED